MPSFFIEKLPREIRNTIYRNVFEAKTRKIQLMQPLVSESPSLYALDPTCYSLNRYQKINFSLLQTCKQINEESKSIIWKYNSLALELRNHNRIDWEYVQSHSFQRVQNVILELDLSWTYLLKTARGFLDKLAVWTTWGSLRSISLSVATSRAMMEEIIETRRSQHTCVSWPKHLALLASFKKSLNVDAQLKVVVDVGWNDAFSRTNQKTWLEKVTGQEELADIVRELHHAVAGELWQDGILCWKNYVQIAEPFQIALFE